VSYPIKGTPYYDEVVPRLVKLGDWAGTTDRDLRIAGRHSRRYYGFADQLLRAQSAEAMDAARRGLRGALEEVEA
jgi:hypothetical protein